MIVFFIFYDPRQHALEAYMNAVAAVLQGIFKSFVKICMTDIVLNDELIETPLLRSLLEFLDLQSA